MQNSFTMKIVEKVHKIAQIVEDKMNVLTAKTRNLCSSTFHTQPIPIITLTVEQCAASCRKKLRRTKFPLIDMTEPRQRQIKSKRTILNTTQTLRNAFDFICWHFQFSCFLRFEVL